MIGLLELVNQMTAGSEWAFKIGLRRSVNELADDRLQTRRQPGSCAGGRVTSLVGQRPSLRLSACKNGQDILA